MMFAPLALHCEILEQRTWPLYSRAMGENFGRLPVPVREMHDLAGDAGAAGRGTVKRGGSLLARLACAALRFPPEGQYDVHVCFAECDETECWTRHFGCYSFRSQLGLSSGGVYERFGPLRCNFSAGKR